MVKAYLISNRNNFKDFKIIIESNIYYSLDSTLKLYNILMSMMDINNGLKRRNTTAGKIELNKKLSNLNTELGGLLND